MARYWIALATRDTAHAAVRHGICLISGGRQGPLRKLAAGDGVVYYSPQEAENGEALECFTALGRVSDDAPRQTCWDGAPLTPWVRDCDYSAVAETPVRPLLGSLGFVAQPRHWGRTFHRGHMEIAETDFQAIASHMHRAA